MSDRTGLLAGICPMPFVDAIHVQVCDRQARTRTVYFTLSVSINWAGHSRTVGTFVPFRFQSGL